MEHGRGGGSLSSPSTTEITWSKITCHFFPTLYETKLILDFEHINDFLCRNIMPACKMQFTETENKLTNLCVTNTTGRLPMPAATSFSNIMELTSCRAPKYKYVNQELKKQRNYRNRKSYNMISTNSRFLWFMTLRKLYSIIN